jgi:predicted ATPase/class 3 adenylate cyclase
VAYSGDEERRPTGTVTFLFTDVEGSTRWWATDKEAMSASLRVHDAVLRAAIESNGGYVFTTAGDSFAAAFTRPTDAVCAATDAQRALADATWPGPRLLVRMGLHLGEAEERAGDYFGPVVNTAARVEAAGHGGQVLTTETVRLAASIVDAVDLGAHRLRDVAEPIRLFQLGGGTFPPLRVIDPGRSNLPARPTRLIGREDEVARVRGLLTQHRLVTIAAVGGVGKTRLAIAIGESELAHRGGGVWFVDLTTVVDGSDVPAAIANAVGVSLAPGSATDQIVRYLADKAALLILDNCEHVIDDCAEFAERFLAAHGPATILATSREALDVDGERAVVLGSLPTDTPDSAGVRLFVDRAAAVDPAFAVTTDDSVTISAICGRLDGMPLAIELAAARVTVMTTAELLAGLDDRFQLLAGGRRRQRQRTLEAMLDWSYDLLAPEEQEVFRALGVFVDGFDLDAVAALTRSDRTNAMAMVEALVAKSLVVRADGGDVARFTLLETVKAYAEDRLVDAGEAADVRNRHLEHFRSLAIAEGRVPFAYMSVGIRLRHDTSNIAVAFGWASGTEQWTAAGELVAGSAMAFWAAVQMIEYRALADRAIADLAARDRELAGYVQSQVLYALGVVQDWPSFVPMIQDLATSPVPAFRVIGLGMTAWLAAFTDAEVAERYLVRAQSAYDELGTVSERDRLAAFAVIRWAAANLALSAGDYHAALVNSQAALDAGDHSAWTVVSLEHSAILATCLVLIGEPTQALEVVSRRDEYALDYQDGSEIRALAYLALGEMDQARGLVKAHGRRAATGRDIAESDDSLVLLAALAHAEGDDQIARDLLSSMGLERQPATIAFAGDLANRLGMLDELQEQRRRMRVLLTEDHRIAASQRSLAALRAELARRGWS